MTLLIPESYVLISTLLSACVCVRVYVCVFNLTALPVYDLGRRVKRDGGFVCSLAGVLCAYCSAVGVCAVPYRGGVCWNLIYCSFLYCCVTFL